jgi:hypothetical protein
MTAAQVRLSRICDEPTTCCVSCASRPISTVTLLTATTEA